jgi:DNA mismatch repair protein MSH5
MKRQYNGLDDMLSHVAKEIGASLATANVNLNVLFFPQIGFLIGLPASNQETIEFVRLEGWTEIFHTADLVYFKDYRMNQLDETIGDIYTDICGKPITLQESQAYTVRPRN